MESKSSSVSWRNALRRLSSKSGNSRPSGVIESRLRRCSHWAAKLVASDCDFGSASIRRAFFARTPGGWGHPGGLLREHVGLMQLAALRDGQQLIIRDTAPQEERQSRRQLQVADGV